MKLQVNGKTDQFFQKIYLKAKTRNRFLRIINTTLLLWLTTTKPITNNN